MAKLTQSIREELEEYFRASPGGEHALSAQSYESGGTGYNPATDTRLADLVLHRRVNPTWARLRRVIDDLSAPTVEVLRLAVWSPRSLGCRLPSALERGRELAIAAARERELAWEHDRMRYRGQSPMTCAIRVLELDAALQRVHVTPAEVEHVTSLALHHGDIDVDDEIEAIIDRAVDAYVAARDALKATKRAVKTAQRAEASQACDDAIAKMKKRETSRFNRKLKGAA